MTEETLFAAALEKATLAERAAFLEDACAGDVVLRQRVEALLQSHDESEFLKTPAVARAEPGACYAPTLDTDSRSTDRDGSHASMDFLTPSDKPGSVGRLGHYEVHETIGQGGMGVVLKAFDDKLHRVVAIKVLASTSAAQGAARKRFIREARAAAAIRNEHVTNIYAVEDDSPVPYLVMEYIAGVSLQERLDRSGPLEVKEILRIGLQIATGLAAAHAQGLIHRDIKPANILLENHVERVKITDFGLARARDDVGLTQEGMVAGTPQYMAPEQARGEALDHRADLFSLGSVLYALCTGQPPFRAENTLGVLKRVCEDTPRPIREINPDIPPWLVDIVAKLQAKDPTQRFQSADEVAQRLAQDLAALQRGDVRRTPWRRRRIVTAAGLLLFAAGLILTEAVGFTNLAATIWRRFTPEETPQAKNGQGNVPERNGDAAKPQVPGQRDPLKPFVILANSATRRGELAFASFADAVDQALDTDTIEVRGNGPFHTEPILARQKQLCLRAGAGFQPVLYLVGRSALHDVALLQFDGHLVMEGLELVWSGYKVGEKPFGGGLVCALGNSLQAAHCRFVVEHFGQCLTSYAAQLELRSCEVYQRQDGSYPALFKVDKSHWRLENSIICGGGLAKGYLDPPGEDSILLVGNTVLSFGICIGGIIRAPAAPEPVKGPTGPLSSVEIERNLLHGKSFFSLLCLDKSAGTQECLKFLKNTMLWKNRQNVFDIDSGFMLVQTAETNQETVKELPQWHTFWGQRDTGDLQGLIRFEAGNPWKRAPRERRPQDFRLVKGSLGQGVAPGGGDLGADVDSVGPGQAYERWKTTPAYQQWLKDSGQKNKILCPNESISKKVPIEWNDSPSFLALQVEDLTS